MSNQSFPLTVLILGVSLFVGAQLAPAALVTETASQDHTVRRGPTVENGIHIKQSTNNSTDRYGMFRFDSSDFGLDVTSAAFLLTANSDTSVQFQGTFNYRIFGVPDGTTNDEAFVEGSYNPSLGVVYDGSADLVDDTKLTLLGDANSVSAGDTISLSSASLLSFIQADTNDIATFVVIRLSAGGNSTFLDRTTGSPPRLQLDVVPEPSTFALSALGLVSLIGLGRRRKR
jgi:hypothetical protein